MKRGVGYLSASFNATSGDRTWALTTINTNTAEPHTLTARTVSMRHPRLRARGRVRSIGLR